MFYRRLIKVGSWTGNFSVEYCVAALLTTVVYFVSYLRYPATPGNHELNFIGWFNMADQGAYLISAEALGHWNLTPATYIYPLGYPLLGALFVRWFPRHPFLIPDLIFSVGIVLIFYASCIKFVSKIEGSFLTVFLIILSAFTRNKVLPGGLIWFNSLILPWNLIPVFFAAYIAAWLLIFNTADFRKLWIVSSAIALAFFSRPPDILFLGIIYLAGLLDLKSVKEKIIKGFTTNPTLMRKAGISDYRAFAKDILKVVPDRPISFEVFSDEFSEMERQAMEIAGWGN